MQSSEDESCSFQALYQQVKTEQTTIEQEVAEILTPTIVAKKLSYSHIQVSDDSNSRPQSSTRTKDKSPAQRMDTETLQAMFLTGGKRIPDQSSETGKYGSEMMQDLTEQMLDADSLEIDLPSEVKRQYQIQEEYGVQSYQKAEELPVQNIQKRMHLELFIDSSEDGSRQEQHLNQNEYDSLENKPEPDSLQQSLGNGLEKPETLASGSKHEFAIMPTPNTGNMRTDQKSYPGDSQSEPESRIRTATEGNLNTAVDTQFLDQMAYELSAKAQQVLRPRIQNPKSNAASNPLSPKTEDNPAYQDISGVFDQLIQELNTLRSENANLNKKHQEQRSRTSEALEANARLISSKHGLLQEYEELQKSTMNDKQQHKKDKKQMKRDMKALQSIIDQSKPTNINTDHFQTLLGLKDSEACDILMNIHKIVFSNSVLSPRLRHWEMRDLPKMIQEKYTIKPQQVLHQKLASVEQTPLPQPVDNQVITSEDVYRNMQSCSDGRDQKIILSNQPYNRRARSTSSASSSFSNLEQKYQVLKQNQNNVSGFQDNMNIATDSMRNEQQCLFEQLQSAVQRKEKKKCFKRELAGLLDLANQPAEAISSRHILSRVQELKELQVKSKFHENLVQQVKTNLDLPYSAKDIDILKVISQRKTHSSTRSMTHYPATYQPLEQITRTTHADKQDFYRQQCLDDFNGRSFQTIEAASASRKDVPRHHMMSGQFDFVQNEPVFFRSIDAQQPEFRSQGQIFATQHTPAPQIYNLSDHDPTKYHLSDQKHLSPYRQYKR